MGLDMGLRIKQDALLDFVKEMHEGQMRKYTNEEYWTHPLAVAKIVGKYEPTGIEMALCHDLFEDTDCDWEMLFDKLLEIGYDQLRCIEICIGVTELTNIFRTQNYPELNRKLRKTKEAERLKSISYIAQCVKYADIIHNGSTVSHKDKTFAKLYLEEAITIVDGMRIGNINLLAECLYTVKSGLKNL